jgi:PAS domain S-box-containing protein
MEPFGSNGVCNDWGISGGAFFVRIVEALPDIAAPSAFEAWLAADQIVLDAIPAAVCICSPDGVIARFNRRAAALWGRSPRAGDSRERYCGALRLYQQDGTPLLHAGTPVEAALRTGEPQLECEMVIERPDGSRVVVLADVDVLRGDDGAIQGAINCFHDITARKREEQQLRDKEQHSRAILEALPVAVYTTDAAGTMTFFNAAAAELAGHEPRVGKDKWCVSWRLRRPDGTVLPHDECPMAVALKEQRPVRNVEAFAERPDGTLIPFVPYPTPMFDAAGAMTGAVNVLVDTTEAKRAAEREAEQRRLAERASLQLASIVESSDDAIISKDLNGVITTWNKGAERLFGYTADEAVGRSVTMLIPADHLHEEPGILRRIRAGERIEHYETERLRKDGNRIDISLTVSPMRNSDGTIVGASKIARDISERRRAEAQRNLLVAELSHRVKNTLATVISIARQSFATNPNAVEAQRSFNARIRALAQTHSRLAEAQWSGVPLETVLLDELAPYRHEDGANLRISGPVTILNSRQALTLGMAMHELATNAAKYGALSTEHGVVDVRWDVGADGKQLRIMWTEQGGPVVVPPRRNGFGRLLIEKVLASDLGGEVSMHFGEHGLECAITVPLSVNLPAVDDSNFLMPA